MTMFILGLIVGIGLGAGACIVWAWMMMRDMYP